MVNRELLSKYKLDELYTLHKIVKITIDKQPLNSVEIEKWNEFNSLLKCIENEMEKKIRDEFFK